MDLSKDVNEVDLKLLFEINRLLDVLFLLDQHILLLDQLLLESFDHHIILFLQINELLLKFDWVLPEEGLHVLLLPFNCLKCLSYLVKFE